MDTMTEKKLYSIVEFEDGLQVIPNNWFSADLKTVFWPHYTSNKRYDTAVKLMEEPDESTWIKHSIKKIFGAFSGYEKARKKLKDAEDISDLNSCTETEKYFKKSRKDRAAKNQNNSSSNSDKSSEDELFKNVPKVSQKQISTTHSKRTVMQKGNANVSCATCQVKLSKDKLIMKDVEPYSEITTNKDFQLQQCKSADASILNVMCRSKNFLQELQSESQNLPLKSKQQTADLNVDDDLVTGNFRRFVIKKLISLEMKMNIIQRHQQIILEKQSVNTLNLEERIQKLTFSNIYH